MSAAGWGITGAYVLLALLVGSLWLHARLAVWVKLAAVGLVTASYWLVWTTLPGFAGWPAEDELPARFQLLASEIREPDAANGFPGTVHVWVVDLAGGQRAGRPAEDELPARFQLLASEIREPDAANGFPGAVHVWVVDLAGDRPAAAPRAYRLAYGKDLHASLDAAKKRIQEGLPQVGRRTDDVRLGVAIDRSRFGERHDELDRLLIENLPDPRLPEK
ncbi:MAG TPA: hypothetical protein PKC26_14690 [Plasticicumulans sp.]|nr:hypothetical protein [Plasticicumulans sp.]